MRRIGERVEQAHGNRLHLLGQKRGHGSLGVVAIQRLLDTTLVVDALGHRLSQISLDQRLGLGPGHVVEPGHAQGANLQDVAEALRRDQAYPCPLAFQDRVGGNGGAVPDFLDGVG